MSDVVHGLLRHASEDRGQVRIRREGCVPGVGAAAILTDRAEGSELRVLWITESMRRRAGWYDVVILGPLTLMACAA